ncbi:MAG: hypothetical protein COB15_07645 [Flavobacteriales bacterium]|nr:MAG: hypothetical protein COB15_07645 [Flavobacteriales bacterium]
MKTLKHTILTVTILVLLPFIKDLGAVAYAQNWQDVGETDALVRTLFTDTADNLLYIGNFNLKEINGVSYRGVAVWDGNQWDSLGCGMDNYMIVPPFVENPKQVNAITRFQGDVYFGGGFHKTGNVWNSYLSKWNGTTWDSLPTTPNQHVYDLEVINNKLYVVGGYFDSVGTIAADRIAIWDGTIWDTLPPLPATGLISEIIEYQGEIYIGGNMSDQSGNNLNSIAKFNGSSWEAVGTGFVGGLAQVDDFKIYNGDLYIAGVWNAGVGGNVGNNIARWDGTTMHDVGGGSGGVNPHIYDLEVHNGKLYAGGVFTSMGGIPASKLAVWDGSQWCATNDIFYNNVFQIAFYQDTMYIGSGNNVKMEIR